MTNCKIKKEVYCSFCGKPESNVKKLVAGPDGVFICDSCVRVCEKVIRDSAQADNKQVVSLKTPEEIKKQLDKYIVGQDKAKKVLSVAVYNHYKRINYSVKNVDIDDSVEIEKSNILMLGPTGCGKTLLARTLAKILDVPFAVADATTLTEAGYVGDDVENILLKLIQNADYDIEKAQRGIVYIDEIDKIARKGENMSITRDVSGEGVQQALLKIIESTIAAVPPQGGRKHPQQDLIHIDTTNILFICGGAFVGLDKIIDQRKADDAGLGFGSKVVVKNEKNAIALEDIQPHDLTAYGLIPEFVGRLPITVSLEPLTEEALVKIMTEPQNAIVKQYKKLFEIDNINLDVQDDAIKAIAQKAMELKTGARGLRTIFEGFMVDTMYSLPGDSSVEKVIVTKNVVDGTGKPVIIKKVA